MQYDQLPHDDFEAGFAVGFKAVRGTDEAMPLTAMRPRLKRGGMTWFLEGVFAGVEAAVVDLEDFR